MHGHEKSDLVIVAMKRANKAKQAYCGGICAGGRGGVGEAKGEGQGECAPAKHVLDSEPGSRVKSAEAYTATRAVIHPRQEPYAGKPHVRIGAGRAMKRTSLPLQRREFVMLLGGTTAAWPLGARAQDRGKLPTVGFLVPNTRSAASEWIDAFVLRLHELGWVEGRTIAIEYRWVEGHTELFAEIAAEFAELKVNVIVTSGTPAVMALQKATSTIPIVFATAGDPVSTGLVASLARPGGHTTGLATIGDDLAGKRLELLRELVPQLSRLALMGNISNPFTVLEIGQLRKAAATLGFKVGTVEIQRAQDITKAFEGLRARADCLYVCTDAAIIHTNRVQINTSALHERLPTMHGARTYIEGEGLMSYGPNFPNMFRRSADFVDKILRGVKAGEIPVEQPTKFDLVINLKTAKALGIEVPPALLARADEVIE